MGLWPVACGPISSSRCLSHRSNSNPPFCRFPLQQSSTLTMDLPAAVAAPPPLRRPLQPRNVVQSPAAEFHPKPKLIAIRISRPIGGGPGKDNCLISSPKPELEPELKPDKEEGLKETSLAQELAAIRKRRERLREERDWTEKELRNKDMVMQRWAMEMDKWAEEQRNVELELRLLIKLQDLRSSSMMFSPVQSLREKQQFQGMDVQSQMPSPIQSLRQKEQGKSMQVELQEPQKIEEKKSMNLP